MRLGPFRHRSSSVSATTHDPKEAVLEQLAARYEYFAELEQTLVAEGKYTEAQGAHAYGQFCVRAYKAEMDDPYPPTMGKP